MITKGETYIIGEIGQNHNGSVDIAKLIVELIVVVVQLAFHRIVRSDLSDRILHYLDPAF